MAVKCSPFGPKPQFVDANGAPYSGALLFFYASGSATKQNTYTDSTGGTSNANPVVLDSSGRPPNQIWFTEGLTYKVVLAPSTDSDPPTSPIFTVDGLTGINDTTTSADEWVASGVTPTYVSTTSFTLSGDQTSAFHVGRRTKSTVTAGTIYSVISASSYNSGTALTTVTVVNDSGTLDSGLSAVSLGLLRSDNPSVPILTDTRFIVSGSSDKTKKVRLEVDGNTTGTTRVLTVPDFDGTIATLDGTETLTNKTLTSPTIGGHCTIEGVTPTGATGTGNLVFSVSPTFTGTVNVATLAASSTITLTHAQDAVSEIRVTNNSSGTSAQATFTTDNGTVGTVFGMLGHSFTTSNALVADRGFVYSTSSAGIGIFADNASAPIVFCAGGTAEQMRLDTSCNLLLATTSTAASAVGCLHMGNATAPTGSITGGVLYVEGGALKFRGSSGTVTTIASA